MSGDRVDFIQSDKTMLKPAKDEQREWGEEGEGREPGGFQMWLPPQGPHSKLGQF